MSETTIPLLGIAVALLIAVASLTYLQFGQDQRRSRRALWAGLVFSLLAFGGIYSTIASAAV